MKFRWILVVLAIISIPTMAFSGPLEQGTGFAGAHYTMLNYDEDGISEELKPSAFIGRLGYFVVKQIAIEGRIGTGLSDDSVTVNTYYGPVEVDLELDSLFGVYATGYLPIGDVASVYGIVGFTKAKAKMEASAAGAEASASASDSGLSYGAGIDFYPSDKIGFNAEYMLYLDESGYELSGIGVGVKFLF